MPRGHYWSAACARTTPIAYESSNLFVYIKYIFDRNYSIIFSRGRIDNRISGLLRNQYIINPNSKNRKTRRAIFLRFLYPPLHKFGYCVILVCS